MSSGNSDSSPKYDHHDVELVHLDPSTLEIDEVNERKTNTGPRTDEGNLEKSIEENGIENPPQARAKENGTGYKVFAGQRRVQAAQAVGLEEIPVIIKDLDDMQALAASVNENNEHLNKPVTRKDRAKAIDTLSDNWSKEKIAEEFGVTPQTVTNWMEPTRDFWAETIFDPDTDTDLQSEYIATDVLQELRRVAKKKDFAERIAKIIIEKQIPKKVVRRALRESEDPAKLMQILIKEWEAHSSGQGRIESTIALVGDDAEMLRRWAKSRGMNFEEAMKTLVLEKLEEEFDSSN